MKQKRDYKKPRTRLLGAMTETCVLQGASITHRENAANSMSIVVDDWGSENRQSVDNWGGFFNE
jgi:hypothetical protein